MTQGRPGTGREPCICEKLAFERKFKSNHSGKEKPYANHYNAEYGVGMQKDCK